jgi:flagellar biosynthesis/type III secretory pathway M-ring protein FliF/YscJ
MDWLRQVLNQATAAFRAMTAAQRASMIMLGLTIAVALGLVAVLGARPKYVTLASGLDQNELGAVARYLDEAGERYQLNAPKGEVLVLHDRKPALYNKLVASRVVAPQKLFGEDAFIEKGGALWVSDKHRQDMMRIAIANELQKTICSLEGVENCTVHIKPESGDEFNLNPEKVGVGITLTMRGGAKLDQQFANSVIDLSASVVRNADPKLVKVLDARDARRCFSKEDPDTEIFVGKNRLSLRSQVENYYQRKLNEFLTAAGYEGAVTVSCELNLDKIKEVAKKYPEDQVVFYQRTKKSDVTGATGPGGATGYTATEPLVTAGPSTTGSPGTPERRKESEIETRSDFPSTYTEILRTPGKVSKLAASVIIFDRIVQKKDEKTGKVVQAYEPFPEDKIGEWKAMVANALTVEIPEGKKLEDVQSISIYHMKPPKDDPGSELAGTQPGVRELVANYWPVARIGGVLMLTAVAFFFLYALGKRAATAPPPEMVVQAPCAGGEAAAEEAGAEPDDVKLRQLQDKLRGMVSQDPRKVATLVKRWLTHEG